MLDDAKMVARRILTIRYLHKLKQHELRKQIDISSARLSEFESGKSRITLEYADRLCAKFGASLDWIYYGQASNVSAELFKGLPDAEVNLDKWLLENDGKPKRGRKPKKQVDTIPPQRISRVAKM